MVTRLPLPLSITLPLIRGRLGFLFTTSFLIALLAAVVGFSLTTWKMVVVPPVSIAEISQIASVWSVGETGERKRLSGPQVEAIQRGTVGVQSSAAMLPVEMTLRLNGGDELTRGAAAQPSAFRFFGSAPVEGRYPTSQDPWEEWVVLSANVWAEEFGRDPTVIGSILETDRGSFRIAAIAPAGYCPIETESGSVLSPDFLIGLSLDQPNFKRDDLALLGLVVRRQDSVAFPPIQQTMSSGSSGSFVLSSLKDALLGGATQSAQALTVSALLVAIMGVIAFAFICAFRVRRDTPLTQSLRSAGGSERHFAFVVGCELCIACGIAVPVAGAIVMVASDWFWRSQPNRWFDIATELRPIDQFMWALFSSVVFALLFFLVHLLLRRLFQPGRSGRPGELRQRLVFKRVGLLFVATQTTITTALLITGVAAALAVIGHLQAPLGASVSDRFTCTMRIGRGIPPTTVIAPLLDELRRQPDVTLASSSQACLLGCVTPSVAITSVGEANEPQAFAQLRIVYDDFFSAAGLRVIEGDPDLLFSEGGRVVLSKSVAVRLFGTESPVGRDVQLILFRPVDVRVVGVVDDVLDARTHAPQSMAFVSLEQVPDRRVELLVGYGGAGQNLFSMLERLVSDQPGLSMLSQPQSLQAAVRSELRREITVAHALAMIGGFSALLGLVCLALTFFALATNDSVGAAIRRALGANIWQIQFDFLMRTLLAALVGVVIGLGLGVVNMRVLASGVMEHVRLSGQIALLAAVVWLTACALVALPGMYALARAGIGDLRGRQ